MLKLLILENKIKGYVLVIPNNESYDCEYNYYNILKRFFLFYVVGFLYEIWIFVASEFWLSSPWKDGDNPES